MRYGMFDYLDFFRDSESQERKEKFIKSKMMKRNRKLKGNKRGKRK